MLVTVVEVNANIYNVTLVSTMAEEMPTIRVESSWDAGNQKSLKDAVALTPLSSYKRLVLCHLVVFMSENFLILHSYLAEMRMVH